MASGEGDSADTGGRVGRSRYKYAALTFAVVLLGLASRAYSPHLPPAVRDYAGDALWALAAYLTIALLFPRLAITGVAVAAGLFSLAVEVSQLYHAPWVDDIRRTRVGGSVLGHAFLWSDLICYGVGVGVGALSERIWARGFRSGRPRTRPGTRGDSRVRRRRT